MAEIVGNQCYQKNLLICLACSILWAENQESKKQIRGTKREISNIIAIKTPFRKERPEEDKIFLSLSIFLKKNKKTLITTFKSMRSPTEKPFEARPRKKQHTPRKTLSIKSKIRKQSYNQLLNHSPSSHSVIRKRNFK